MQKTYVVASGLVFGVIAVAQASRALMQVSVHAGNFEVPIWASWVAAMVAGGFCVRIPSWVAPPNAQLSIRVRF